MTAKEIINVVCDYFKVDPGYIATNSRKGDIIKIKHLAIYFVRGYTTQSLTSVGSYFVGTNPALDHCSVLHAVSQVENQVDTDPRYRKQFNEIDEIIRYKNRYANMPDEDVFEFQGNDFYTNN